MCYTLIDGVYIIKGKNKDCIYDLRQRKLYHIQKSFSDLIEKVCSAKSVDLTLSDEERKAIENLQKSGLVGVSNEIKPFPDIKTLDDNFHIQFVWIEICTFCNLRCKHCYNESSAKCNDVMSFDDFKVVCSELADMGVKKVQLIGGEPFCHKNIREMLAYAAERFEFVEVFTNGILINEEWCCFFKKHNIHVAMSIYSYNAEEHDKVTLQNGSHNKTVHAVELLKKYTIPHRIATVYMKDVSVEEKNTDLYTLNPKKDVIRMAGRGNLALLTPDLLKRKLITKNTFSHALNPKDVALQVHGNRCFSSKLYISANLEVYPCVMERRFSHGNLRGQNLAGLLKREIQEFNKDRVVGCKDCEFRYACYDCRPDSLSDDIYAKPYYCTYNVEKGEFESEDTVIARIFN